jgi:hypothetical protein
MLTTLRVDEAAARSDDTAALGWLRVLGVLGAVPGDAYRATRPTWLAMAGRA